MAGVGSRRARGRAAPGLGGGFRTRVSRNASADSASSPWPGCRDRSGWRTGRWMFCCWRVRWGRGRRWRQRVIVAWGGVSLGEQCGFEGVLAIRRIRGWVGAESIRPRVATRGYPEPQLRCSIRMACRGRIAEKHTSTAASQLSPNPQGCKGKRAFLFGIMPRARARGKPSENVAQGS